MIVHAYCHVKNDRALMAYWLRFYAAFCTELHVYDDESTDGTRELVQAHPKARLHDIPFNGLDERALLDLATEGIKQSRRKADYVIWSDVDEFVWHPQILECLARFQSSGYNVCRTLGMNMMGAPLPEDDGVSQLTNIYRTGVRAPVYSKPIVVAPDAPVQWSCGKHSLQNEYALRVSPWEVETEPHPWRLRLLHYRYLCPDYVRERNARQYERSTNKSTAWSCAPDYKGEHSDVWVAATMKYARDVVCDEACYLQPGINDA